MATNTLFKNTNFRINESIVYAEDVSFSEKTDFQRLDELAYHKVETIVSSRPQSDFSVNGYLTRGGFQGLNLTGLIPFSGGINGLGFNSGFLTNYSISVTPVGPIKFSIGGVSYQKLNRSFEFDSNDIIYEGDLSASGFFTDEFIIHPSLKSGEAYVFQVDFVTGGDTFYSQPDLESLVIGSVDIINPSQYFQKSANPQGFHFVSVSNSSQAELSFNDITGEPFIFSGIKIFHKPFVNTDLAHGAFSTVETGSQALLFNTNLLSLDLSFSQSVTPYFGVGGTNIIGLEYGGGQISCSIDGTGIQRMVDFECDSGTNLVLTLKNLCNTELEDIRVSGFKITSSSISLNESEDVVGKLEMVRYF